ncbi:hypothetical protein GCM10022291_00020 [Postechiella marina]|uniref:Fibronectin type-III domain-containing protein n=1 Tax=Postechiella marina TaxID=943941 RepID=A0ABP8BYD5_9FLAO
MILRHIKRTALVLTLIFIVSCGSSSNDDSNSNNGGDDKILPPEAATLVTPLKNEECNQGNILSKTESTVAFQWNKSSNTNNYTIIIKNLNTDTIQEKTTSSNSASFTLLRGVPYSWHVISKSNKTTKVATSETWNLFNAGEAEENYAPFPASIISPKMGSITSNPVNLEWLGSDLDNDIATYDIYLGTTNPPTELQKENTNTNTENNISLTNDTVYYWIIVTKDEAGNTSKSPVFEFRTEI